MRRSLLISVVMFACISLSGCSRVNPENYGKLKMGQTYGEVVAILGEPAQCEAVLVAKNCHWGKEPKTITVNFVGDKVILFSSAGL